MLSSIGEGVIATDNKAKITMINQATTDILGWTEEELIGTSIIDRIPMLDETERQLEVSERPMTKVLSFGKPIVTSPLNYYIRKDKTKVPVRFTVTPIILDGKVEGTIEIFYDITREKEIENAKSDFVSVASHELRTPLTVINWTLESMALVS